MTRFYSLLLLLICSAAPLAAQPYLYWGRNGVGRANLDGTGSQEAFISSNSTTAGLATDGTYIYWTDPSGAIGRARLDGTDVNETFITGIAANTMGITANSTHLYWTNPQASTSGRARLDGTDVNDTFITGQTFSNGLDATDSYFYWATGAGIGRANLDGTDVNPTFITGASNSNGVVVVGPYIYWIDTSGVGRANLDGTGVSPNFILDSSPNNSDITSDGTHLYWMQSDMRGNDIGRAKLDGTDVNTTFMRVQGWSFGLTTMNSAALPVELTSFTATLDGTRATLRWETASETNNSGFDVEHRAPTSTTFRTLGFAPGRGTTLEAQRYHFTAESLTLGRHVFRLRQVDFDGAVEYSPEIELTLDADALALTAQATPRGIAGTLALPQAGMATVTLYDVLGRQVATQQVGTGAFVFEASLASGLYVVRVEAGAQTLTQTVVVAR